MRNIVLLDSGLGGLSALKELYKKLPSFNYIYFADTKNLPYGSKTKQELLNITIQNINYIKQKFNPLVIIFGCNTLGTTVLEDIQNIFKEIKFFALKPNLNYALKLNFKHILLLGTTQTINQMQKLSNYNQNKNRIILCEMPLLASKVEIYIQNPMNIVPYLKEKLSDYSNIDCIILGCSHYYFVKKQLKGMFKMANIIDGTKILAKEVVNFLNSINYEAEQKNIKQNSKIKLIITGKSTNKKNYNQIIQNIIKSKNSW